MARQQYSMPAGWLDRPIRVVLVGVGGNGSEVLDALGRMHLSLRAVGHPYGLQVTAIDPDTITESNIVRQRFYPAEIGQPKAWTAIQRMNLFLGVTWDSSEAPVAEWLHDHGVNAADLIIGCVDSVSARNDIAHWRDHHAHEDVLYLDLGNGEASGQVVLGHLLATDETPVILSIVQDLFPEIAEAQEEDDTPSCSAEESLQRQTFGINRTMATMAINLLWNLFTQPAITHHGCMVDTRRGRVVPLPIDPDVWSSLSGADLTR